MTTWTKKFNPGGAREALDVHVDQEAAPGKIRCLPVRIAADDGAGQATRPNSKGETKQERILLFPAGYSKVGLLANGPRCGTLPVSRCGATHETGRWRQGKAGNGRHDMSVVQK
jgi:hypothetical protein